MTMHETFIVNEYRRTKCYHKTATRVLNEQINKQTYEEVYRHVKRTCYGFFSADDSRDLDVLLFLNSLYMAEDHED